MGAIPSSSLRTTSEDRTRAPVRSASAAASVDFPLAASPQTIAPAPSRTRHVSRAASASRPAHLDDVLDRARRVLGGEADATVRPDERADAEIHVRCEPSVEPDLLGHSACRRSSEP